MQDTTTTITDSNCTEDGKQDKTFNFDYSFWSHDEFKTLPNGYSTPNGPNSKYYDQAMVYKALGEEILDNAWEGYHCCLFAYGQTGSGKSYSMVGYGENKGIIPISCDEIFKRIKNTTTSERSYELCVSMLEIYNEKVQDLLVPVTDRPPLGLKVRENKTLGIFVEGLSKHIVTSYDEIKSKMDSGSDHRTIGSTLMNATSSRAHTIVTIEFKQINVVNGKRVAKTSDINLVDLAGSERSSSTGATGDRLKEGSNINKSLSTLGKVINTLADKAMGKKKDVLPPYRESNLTRILQSALGGNAKTVMICALSPANINYDETLSTLRYAESAKKIKNKAVINESEGDKVVRLLKEENNDLKKMIEEMNKKMSLQGGMMTDADKKNLIDISEQFEANSRLQGEMEKSYDTKLEEQKKKEKEIGFSKVDITKPHLVVLNEDPQLSHKLKYSLNDLPVYVGRKHGDPTPQIVLSGIGVKMNHASFEAVGSEVMIIAGDENAQDFIFINGRQMEDIDGEILSDGDLITFGNNTIFLYMKKSDGHDILKYTWEDAQKVLVAEQQKNLKKKEELNEIKRKAEINDLKSKYEKEYAQDKKLLEEKMKREMEELQKTKEGIENTKNENDLQSELKRLDLERAKRKRELEIKEINEHRKTVLNSKHIDAKHKSQKLEQNLQNILRKLHKMMVIVEEIRRNVKIEPILLKDVGEYLNEDYVSSSNILIRVENYEEGTVYYWNTETFQNRYDLMKDIFNRYLDEDLDISNLSSEEDPLWDEPKPVLVGNTYYKLEPLGYKINNPTELAAIITSNNTTSHNAHLSTFGNLNIDVIPHDENYEEYEDVPESPEELIGQNINFTVSIKEIKNLPTNFCQSVYIKYESIFNLQSNKTKMYGEKVEDIQQNYNLDENFEHTIEYITKDDVEFMKTENINFKVYAIENIEKKGKLPDSGLFSLNASKRSSCTSERRSRVSMSIDLKKLAIIQEENMRKDKENLEKLKLNRDEGKKKEKDCNIF